MTDKSTVAFQNKQANKIDPEEKFITLSSFEKKKLVEESDDWLITYADAVTLLLAFFVLILSVSNVSQEKFENISQAINEQLLEKDDYKSPLQDLYSKLKIVFEKNDINVIGSLRKEENSLKIDLPSELLFPSGSSNLGKSSLDMISDIADQVKTFPLDNFKVEIEGHSDDIPIHTQQFPSNWELSASRAISVLKVFIDRGVDSSKLKAVGYADTKPKRPNRDSKGLPIELNQQINRRVEIIIKKDF
ncbi:OmpA/MotB family protein [Thiomicrorhabdus sediminis]|uniref:Cell envelope biogenesis protein OmpA n=1 Tax=Thiomicrorhabdus sediminis TaxID=2580412 RepID=A0A4P9K606_9GAMM|nr:flagellar motor protein MotB [Thiomicrorhabdus sediminis]QCU90251.1 cell envelope biogenesis protein OmpA [Thiomicrorhabdus sediminis]